MSFLSDGAWLGRRKHRLDDGRLHQAGLLPLGDDELAIKRRQLHLRGHGHQDDVGTLLLILARAYYNSGTLLRGRLVGEGKGNKDDVATAQLRQDIRIENERSITRLLGEFSREPSDFGLWDSCQAGHRGVQNLGWGF